MHSVHKRSLFLIITDSAKILHAYDEIFLGKCGVKRSRLGSLQCFKYNHNYNKIVKSDWRSTALISALIGQFNRKVRVMPK